MSALAESGKAFLRSYLLLTIQDKVGSGVVVLFWPAHSIWLAPLLTENATIGGKERTVGDMSMQYMNWSVVWVLCFVPFSQGSG